jgi:hypothetical protein
LPYDSLADAVLACARAVDVEERRVGTEQMARIMYALDVGAHQHHEKIVLLAQETLENVLVVLDLQMQAEDEEDD